ncbi:MAG: hypothetical protein IPK83_14570 [Planctomycetes bacterium]|nr:hypothetical protein [Planctomycetota bacterium]
MKSKTLFVILAITAICTWLVAPTKADMEHCTTHTAGVQTTGSPSFHNIGQSVVGISTGAATIARHGSLNCLRVHTTCILGDVNGDYLIDGEDVQRYTEVKLTDVGTPRISAASPTVPEFVNLLLNQ